MGRDGGYQGVVDVGLVLSSSRSDWCVGHGVDLLWDIGVVVLC